ncbi:MAG: hypothetical protein ABIG43_06860 [Chloroflexota bacterium]
MKLVINEKLINRNKRIGQIATFSSLAILAGGLFLAFQSDITRMLLSYVALIVGFITSQVGIYYTNRFGRNPRFDELFTKNLQKLSNQYTFYVYSSPIPMLLVGPSGFWLPIPISAGGNISYMKNRWRQQGGNFLMKLFAQEGIGRPSIEEAANISDLTKYIRKVSEINDNLPPMQTVLVLMNENAEIGDVENAPTQIIHIKKLRRYLRKVDRDYPNPLSDEALEAITALFS